MPQNIPTTQESKEVILVGLETALNQESPALDRSFLKVLSSVLAGQSTGFYKLGAQQSKENFIISASKEGLQDIGNELNVAIKAATAAVFTIDLPATDGTIIESTIDFVGDPNGIRYDVDASATATGGSATISVTSQELGVAGNLNLSETMTIGTPVAGADSIATIINVDVVAADEEDTEEYRIRLLDAFRNTGGGGNSASYRVWAEEAPNVIRAYPYSGNATGPTAPPERIVFIEADPLVDPNGIAPLALLQDARDSITTDPSTNLARQPLGLTDATLFVESITRRPFYVEVQDLTVDAGIETQVKTDIASAVDTYFRSLRPFIDGLTPIAEKNDVITDLTIGAVVEDIVTAAGGSVEGVRFGLAPGPTTIVSIYTLDKGELASEGDTTFVP